MFSSKEANSELRSFMPRMPLSVLSSVSSESSESYAVTVVGFIDKSFGAEL